MVLPNTETILTCTFKKHI